MKNNRILIFDTTLRDGEQCPGASMNLREKLEVARQLARLKVDVIEAGFPVTSEGEFTAVQRSPREIKGPIIAGLARCVPKDIDAAAEAIKPAGKRGRIHVFLATSKIHREFKLGKAQARDYPPGHRRRETGQNPTSRTSSFPRRRLAHGTGISGRRFAGRRLPPGRPRSTSRTRSAGRCPSSSRA